MNNLRNKVQLIGNLGATPIVRAFGKDKKIANFSIATKETFYNKEGELITNTQWHHLVCWNKTAEIAEKYLDKGSQIAIEGKIRNDNWQDKEGNKRTTTKIMVNEIMILRGK